MWRSTPSPANAGFTLIEVLIALSIVALALASIGALTASTTQNARSVEARFNRLEIARAVMTALPERDQLINNNLSGITSGHTWRVDVSPLHTKDNRTQNRTPWLPQVMVVTVQSPVGTAMQIHTIRLNRR